VDWENVGRISKDRYDESPEIMLKQDDILMTKDGTIGKIAYVDELPEPATVASGVFVVRKDREELEQRYLWYYLKSHFFRHLIRYRTEGSVIPHLYQRDFVEMDIALPPVSEQKNIAGILFSLDEKIRLLKKENEKLNALSELLFKHWFVDFNFPTKKGTPYLSTSGEMVSTEIGEIPKDWKTKSIFEIAEYINGSAFKQEDFEQDKEGALPIIKIAELKNGITDQTCYTQKVKDNRYLIGNEEIIFSWSGSPETSIDIFLWFGGKAILNQHAFKVIPKKVYGKIWVYYQLKILKKFFIHLAKQKQTTGLGHVTIADLKSNLLPIPPEELIHEFNKKVEPMFQKVLLNRNQIEELMKLRNTLIPKLISGIVRGDRK
ncbi:MAG: restriction endonuclease subunit S, partial [Candidatus Omnitrophica bacterium]|nr:restriction endonuclease subunit S [Candidatus Omnitrophota bacterium]